MFKKEAFFFVTFRVWLYKNNEARQGGYPTHGDVADMSNFFYFHFMFILPRGMTL